MKTRQRDTRTTTGLPPPPAPPARDANPWPIGHRDDPREAGRGASAPGAAARRRRRATRFATQPPPSIKPRRRPLGALFILVFIVVSVIGVAVRVLETGRIEEVIPTLLAVLFMAIMVWRSLKGRRS